MRVTRHSSDGSVTIDMPVGPSLRLRDLNPRAVAHSVQGSTAALDVPWLPEVIAYGLTALIAASEPARAAGGRRLGYAELVERAERQAQCAAYANAVRSRRIAEAVRDEGRLLSTAMPMYRRVAIVARGIGNRLEAHELRRVPSARVIRSTLRRMDEEKNAVASSETTNLPAYPSCIPTSGGG